MHSPWSSAGSSSDACLSSSSSGGSPFRPPLLPPDPPDHLLSLSHFPPLSSPPSTRSSPQPQLPSLQQADGCGPSSSYIVVDITAPAFVSHSVKDSTASCPLLFENTVHGNLYLNNCSPMDITIETNGSLQKDTEMLTATAPSSSLNPVLVDSLAKENLTVLPPKSSSPLLSNPSINSKHDPETSYSSSPSYQINLFTSNIFFTNYPFS